MMFLERLIQTGMQDNPYWYSLDYNWFAKNDLWLPNCTCFSCGRSSEAAGRNVKLQIPRGNAQTWYDASNWIGSRTPQEERSRSGEVASMAMWELLNALMLMAPF